MTRKFAVAAPDFIENGAEAGLRGHHRLNGHREAVRHVDGWCRETPRTSRCDRHAREERLKLLHGRLQSFEPVPFVTWPHTHGLTERLHLLRRHQPGVVVLVAGEGQSEALDRVANEAGRLCRISTVESIENRWKVMPAEIVHQGRELVVAPLFDQLTDVTLVADLIVQSLAPGRAARKHQCRVELIGTIVDPAAQGLAARLLEGRLLQRAVFDDGDVPAEVLEQLLVALPKALANHGVEALAVVIDDPPAIAQALLPAFEQCLEDVALVELGIADQRDHSSFGPCEAPATRAHVVLRERGKQSLRDAETDRTGREVDVVDVFSAGRVALRTLVAAKRLQALA